MKNWGKKQRGQLTAKSVVGASMCFLGSRKVSTAVGKLPRGRGMRRAGRGTQGLASRVGNLHREPLKDLSRRVVHILKALCLRWGQWKQGDQV